MTTMTTFSPPAVLRKPLDCEALERVAKQLQATGRLDDIKAAHALLLLVTANQHGVDAPNLLVNAMTAYPFAARLVERGGISLNEASRVAAEAFGENRDTLRRKLRIGKVKSKPRGTLTPKLTSEPIKSKPKRR